MVKVGLPHQADRRKQMYMYFDHTHNWGQVNFLHNPRDTHIDKYFGCIALRLHTPRNQQGNQMRRYPDSCCNSSPRPACHRNHQSNPKGRSAYCIVHLRLLAPRWAQFQPDSQDTRIGTLTCYNSSLLLAGHHHKGVQGNYNHRCPCRKLGLVDNHHNLGDK